MRRAIRIGAGLVLALFVVTCTDERMTGPHRPGHVALDFSSFLATAGQNGSPDIPFDSLRVVLTRTADRTTALDTVFQVRGDTLSGDSIALRLNISLTQNSEQFNLVITTYGAGLPWYQASDTVTITAGATAAPALTARYVGRGANAARVQMLPADTTMFGGDSFPLHAVVYDSSSAVIDSVPVGYRTSDSLNTNISNSTYRSSLYAQPAQRDSVWVVAETPTHLRDSTRVHINPPAVAVAKDSGDGQSGSTGVALGQAFVVRVTDALSGPFQGRRVIWTITAGSGTLSSGTATDTTFTDSTGRARTTLTGSAPAAFSVSAASAGLAGSPQTFSATITNPVANTLTLVSGTAQVDTVGRALAAPFVVKATIGGVTPVAGAKIAWSTRTGGATRSSDTTLTAGNGQAQITVTLGTTAGTDTVRASLVGTAQFVDFAATALVSHPHLISIVSGDAQTDTAGRTLALPLVVLVTDSLLNPIAGTKVAWQVVYGLGTPTPDTVATDAGGHAQVSYKLGNTAGTDTVAAKLIANGVSVKFDETAVSGAIASVKVVPKIDTLPKGDSLQYSDTLKDSIGNVVGGAVTWSSTNPTVATVTAAGLARLLAAGQAGIIAAAAGHADTAQLFVRALTTIAVSPSDTVVTAVGDSLLLTARGVDNFGATVPGTVIRFSSASPSIATVNAITGRVHITGPGNAVLLAKDSISGIQGPATVHVNQIVFGVANVPPDSVVLGIGGKSQIVAKALDKHGFPIPGKTFGWVIRPAGPPVVASVDQTGLVTGDTIGHTYAVDTLADSAGIFRDSTLVSVVPVPPALLQWAFDSVAVGNGGNLSVGLSVTRPPALGPLTVKIVSSDTLKVKPASNTATIAPGGSGTSVTINGLAAGRVTLVAQDSTGAYQPDTMIVTVISTIEFREIGQFSRQTNFYVNQNETHQAQVFLSDPAPAGGIGVTFVYGKGGVTAVTPAPAVIPGGQLAANVTITGTGVGTDSVIPTSGGFVGKASLVQVARDSLQLQVPYPYTSMLGVGQSFQPYAQITYSMDHPLVFDASLGAGIGTAQSPDTIPTNSNYRYFTVTATAPGVDTLTVSAPGWIAARAPLIFTTPRLQAGGTTSIIAGDPTLGYWQTSTEDSLASQHPVTSVLTVTAVSRNPAAVAVDSPTVHVQPGSSSGSVYGMRALPAAGGDSAWIVETAPGYRPDSFLVHVAKPTLTLQVSYPYDGRVAVNTAFPNAAYVQLPYVRPDTFWVVFSNTRKGVVNAPDSVAIPAGASYSYLNIQGDTVNTVDTMTVVRATGYQVSQPTIVWTVDSLHAYPGGTPCCLVTISPPQIAIVYLRDAVDGQSRNLLTPLRATLTSSKPAEFTLDSAQVTIPAGSYYSNYDTLRVVGADTAGGRVLTTAPGSTPDSSGLIRVTPTPLAISLNYPYSAARGLRGPINNYVYLPAVAPSQVKIAIAHTNHAIDSIVPDTVLINAGQSASYQSGGYFRIYGLDSIGTDTITATAPGFVAAAYNGMQAYPARLTISNPGLNHLTTEAPYRILTQLQNAAYGASENPTLPMTFTFVSTNPNVIQVDSAVSVNATFDTATNAVDSSTYFAYTRVRFIGSGSAYLKAFAPGFHTDSVGPITVSGPQLHWSATNVTVGVGQVYQNQYVYVDNPVASPLVVHVQRSDSTLPPASQAFLFDEDSLIIPTGNTGSYASGTPGYLNITGNSVATAQLIGRAAGYGQVTTTVAVGQPQLVAPTNVALYVGQQPYSFPVYTEDQNGISHVVAAPLTITDSSTDPAIAIPSPTSEIVPAQQYYAYDSILPLAKGAVSIVFRATGYKPDTTVVSVDTGTLVLQNATSVNGLGAGEVSTNDIYVQIPYSTQDSLVVSLSSANPGVATVPATVVIPPGYSYAYFPVTGVSPGVATINATAPNAHPAVGVNVRISKPQLLVAFTTNPIVGQKYSATIYAQDSVGRYRDITAPLTVTLVSSNPTHTAFDSSTMTIPGGQYFVSTGVVFDTAGTYTITASAPGFTNGSSSTITAQGALVSMTPSFTFVADTVTIPAGTYVSWKNTSGVLHSTTSDTGLWGGDVNAGTTSSPVYFGTPGTYYYHCRIHGTAGNGTSPGTGMVGVVIVQ